MRGSIGIVVCAALMLGQTTPLRAQSAPNRAAAVCAVTGAHPEVFQGPVEQSDARRLAFLPTIINALNHIDGGNWGELLKETRKIPADIIVWRPTLEHFDVMTDSGCYWELKGVIAASWQWLAVADTEPVPVTPPPVIVTPPPAPPPLLTIDYDRIGAIVKTIVTADGDVTRAAVDNPGFVKRFVSNRYVQIAGGVFATCAATRCWERWTQPQAAK